ncbi:MAG TPA: ABC transporter ATP-binding protein [Alphaproteobacteria bacterium]|nr:ABC transporter ATP-binding protein [Alphaproteobacteria bacterium]
MTTLRLTGITRFFDGTLAVDDVNLDVADGEFLTLLGPSGCGKTTTLRMVAGFIVPDRGDIWFGERRMTEVPPHKRNTAMVFQSYALFPHMSVADNVGFGLRMRKTDPAERATRIAEALEIVGLTGLEKRRPGQLSGGQQQRVALARAIVTRPDVLLFDEPLSNLDAKLREKVRHEIRELQTRLGITAIYVTHDQDEALVMSDRIVVMNRGRIEQIGVPAEIYRRPKTAFVADFLGLANIVEGTLEGEGRVMTPLGALRVADTAGIRANPVKICWRPEDMKLAASGQENRISGVARQVIFRGHVTEVRLEVNGQSLRVQVDSDRQIREGDTLTFGLAADRIRVLA